MATFGKTTDGSNVQTFSGDRVYICSGTPASGGTVQSGWGRVRVTGASTSEVKFVIFSDNGGEPDVFLAESDEVIVNWTTSTLTEFPFSGGNQISIVSGTPYWIGFWFDDPGTPSFEMKRDNTAGLVRFATDAYPGSGSPTSPFSSGGSSNGPLNAYVEYDTTAPSVLNVSVFDSVSVTEIFSFGGTWLAAIEAWLYPGPPAQNANFEYSDGRVIRVLKPEYYTINSSGALIQLVDDGDPANKNAYNATNAADVKAHSSEQYFTISGNAANTANLCASSIKRAAAISVIVSFLDTIGFTGVELDWEGFGSWSLATYSNYKTFVTDLGNTLHNEGYKLMIDGPPISNATEQGFYEWIYSDFDLMPVDYICVMAYDYQFDYGGGESVQPVTWVQNICDWVTGEITDIGRLVIGMPSYGYHATTGDYDITIDTKVQSALRTGYSSAARNADYEMEWATGGVSSVFQDSGSMNAKRTVIEAKGIRNISVWHLGGNDWFVGKSEPSNDVSVSPAENVTITENVNLFITKLLLSVFDTVTITENVKPTPSLPSPIIDSVTITENTSLNIPLPVVTSDNVTITESITLQIPVLFMNVFEAVTVTDVIFVGIAGALFIFDSITITESVSLDLPLLLSVSDTVTITENVSMRANILINAFELVAIDETVQNSIDILITTLFISTFELVTISEFAVFNIFYSVNVNDLVTVSESVAADPIIKRTSFPFLVGGTPPIQNFLSGGGPGVI